MTESTHNPELASVIDPTKQAIEMSEWFPDYMFGAIDEPGALPQMTRSRLRRHFGDDFEGGLRLVCDEIPMMDPDMQPDVAAYICGFPKNDLEAMLENQIGKVILELDKAFPPIKKDPKPSAQPGSLSTRRPSISYVPTNSAPAQPNHAGVMPWADYALCAQTNPEAFFPEKGGSTREAKQTCYKCETRAQCLIGALATNEEFGIWGGFSRSERNAMLKSNEKAGGMLTLEEVAEKAIQDQIKKAKENAKKADEKKASKIRRRPLEKAS